MKSVRFSVVLATSILSVGSVLAQAPPPDPSNSQPYPLRVLTPPTPNTAALGEFGKVPVGLFTGTIQQSIPLCDVKTQSFSYPISLNYQSNGTLVGEIGSNVGLGWSLNGSGVITRNVNDLMDEKNVTERLGLMTGYGIDSPEMRNFLNMATTDNNYDTEPDLYSFNFGPYSGKFYITGASSSAANLQAVLIEPSPLKFEFLTPFNNATSLESEQIRITDPDGIVYIFGGTNAIEQNNSTRTYLPGDGGANVPGGPIKTAWYLTKIIQLNGEEIVFTYQRISQIYDAGISQVITSSISCNSAGTCDETSGMPQHTIPQITKINASAPQLSQIEWKTGKIVFTYSPRFDASSDTRKLDLLQVYSKQNTDVVLQKQYAFNYLLAGTSTTFNHSTSLWNGSYTDNHKRLFLDNLVIKSGLNNELTRYKFEYYAPTELPTRLSFSQDYWGYFNGKVNVDLVTNNLAEYNPARYDGTVADQTKLISRFANVGGNKNPDWNFAVKGVLKKVTYPTGGTSEFEYEPHDYSKRTYSSTTVSMNADATPITTGLIPIDHQATLTPTIRFNDALSCPHGVRTVTAVISVKEVQSGAYLLGPTTITNGTSGNGSTSYNVNLLQGKSYIININNLTSQCTDISGSLTFTYKNGPYTSTNVAVGGVRLKRVVTSDLTGNQQIKRYYYGTDLTALTTSSGNTRKVEPAISYYNPLDINGNRKIIASLSSNTLHELYDNQGYHITYSTVIEGEGDNFEGGATVHNFNNVLETMPTPQKDPIIGTPFNNVFGNGEELNTIFYKKNGSAFVKVKELNNTYTTDSRLANSIAGFKASKRIYEPSSPNYYYNLTPYVIDSKWRYLSSTTEKQYDGAGANPVATTTTYAYNNAVHMQLSTVSVSIMGTGTSEIKRVTQNRYYQDFTYPLTGVFQTMSTKHIFTSPVESATYGYRGTTASVMSAQATTYKTITNTTVNPQITMVVKERDFKYRASGASYFMDKLGFTPANNNSSGTFVYDSKYEQLYAYDRYDNSANLVQLTDRASTYSLITEPYTGNTWAKSDRGNYPEVAYTNFEHSNVSGYSTAFTNFSYGLAGITTSVAQNGTRAYSLSSGGNITNAQTIITTRNIRISFWKNTGVGGTITVKAGVQTVTMKAGAERDGWQYFEGIFAANTSITISGTATIDELRMYPEDARLTTYTFKDGVGVVSQGDQNNVNTFFEYDEFNRLKITRDREGYILKKNEYEYQYIQN